MLKKNLVIIPARKGSKRIKDKNLVKVLNKPLVLWTINFAKKLLLSKKGDNDLLIAITKLFQDKGFEYLDWKKYCSELFSNAFTKAPAPKAPLYLKVDVAYKNWWYK